MTPDLSLSIGTLRLSNPVGVASGTFGYGAEYRALCDLSALGFLVTKAVTLEPRFGNPAPRLTETPSGLLNAIGLTNGGVEAFIRLKVPFLRKLSVPIWVNVAGSEASDYAAVVERLNDEAVVGGFEINLSCPNVKRGCLSLGTDAGLVEALTRQLRELTQKPLIIKLTPNVTDIVAVAKGAEAGGADAVSCINTVLGMAIDIRKPGFALANQTGGLSGPAIKPIGVAAVYRVARGVRIPVIGIGGIQTGADAVEDRKSVV